MICHICQQTTTQVFHTKVLNKYDVNYFHCDSCNFIQTEYPYWLQESYENAITKLDIGLVSRNIYLKEQVPLIIDAFFPESKIMVDYGGGYGLFVRMMRDMGYNFYRQDIYCENLFAKYFDVSDSDISKFDILTAFEVFEHLVQPITEIEKMFALSDNIIFTTEIAPDNISDFRTWWYVSPLTGQHISFYTIITLQFIADKFGKHFYSNGHNIHLFANKNLNNVMVKKVFNTRIESKLERIKQIVFPNQSEGVLKQSLQQKDYKFVEEMFLKNV
jgi:2-polyprenyl-3-methyl-5-hydroxy-6-metoxy-1,4-benzoquinol methylase